MFLFSRSLILRLATVAAVFASGATSSGITASLTADAHSTSALRAYAEPRVVQKTSRIAQQRSSTGLIARPMKPDASVLIDPDPKFSGREWCNGLTTRPNAKPEFRETARSSWECTASLTPGEEQSFGELFIQLNGQGVGDIVRYRAKINLLEPGSGKSLPRLASELLAQLPLMLSEESRAYLESRVIALKAFSSDLEGLSVSFQPEGGDPRRYNLIVLRSEALSEDCGKALLRAETARTLPYSIACLRIPSAAKPPL